MWCPLGESLEFLSFLNVGKQIGSSMLGNVCTRVPFVIDHEFILLNLRGKQYVSNMIQVNR